MFTGQLNLFHTPFVEIFERIRQSPGHFEYDYRKHQISLSDNENRQFGYLRLPLHLKIGEELNLVSEEATVLYLTIEAGNAALCLNRGKQTEVHTTFTSYMSRKKQGFSQIKYLNKKGKSRAGSRVRLAKTLEFFEQINEKLQTIFEGYELDRIALNCTPVLIPYLHQSKVACPFEKSDERLYKIPLHIPQSNYTNLTKAIKKLMAPICFYDTDDHELVYNLFQRDTSEETLNSQ